MYFNTALKRADAPTRDAEPPEPDLEKPPWFDDLVAGDFRSFDEWMESSGAPTGDVELPLLRFVAHKTLT